MPEPKTIKAPKATGKTTKVPQTFSPRFVEDLDHRTALAKEIRRRYETLRDDTGSDASAQRDILCRRAVFLSVVLETAESEALENGKFDSGSYTQMTNAMIGLLRVLGLDKKVKSATDLKSYIEGRAKQ